MRQNRKIKKNRRLFVITGLFVFAIGLFFATQISPKISADTPAPETTLVSSEAAPISTDSAAEATKPSVSIPANIPIFMYHYIRDYTDPSDQIGVNLSVSPLKFAAHLDALTAQGYSTVTFEDLETGDIPAKPIILTFDDGYSDFYENAFPELKRRSMTGVVFVIAKAKSSQYMSDAQIKEISHYGIEIGSHTLTHPNLVSISSTKATDEITQSKKMLEELTGKSVISFCYPAGKFDDVIVALIKGAGYNYATTTKTGLADFSSALTLSRYRINPDTNVSRLLK